ncbi:MAG TPA: hypothetical protein VGI52_09255, partial [Solirubrobacteraceae bacterium]
MRTRLSLTALMAVFALAASLLSGVAVAAPQRERSAAKKVEEPLPPIETGGNCEFIANPGSPVCMLPFPDDFYTVADPSSATGRRISFTTSATPTNVEGKHVEAAPYNAADGFSPGSVILVKIPGIQTKADLAATGSVPINKLRQYKREKAPIVV